MGCRVPCVVALLAIVVVGLTGSVALGTEPDWKTHVLPAFCWDYQSVVEHAARARQAGVPYETVRAMLLANGLGAASISLGTLHTYLLAVNAVYRGPLLTPKRWAMRAWILCLGSDLQEEALLR